MTDNNGQDATGATLIDSTAHAWQATALVEAIDIVRRLKVVVDEREAAGVPREQDGARLLLIDIIRALLDDRIEFVPPSAGPENVTAEGLLSWARRATELSFEAENDVAAQELRDIASELRKMVD